MTWKNEREIPTHLPESTVPDGWVMGVKGKTTFNDVPVTCSWCGQMLYVTSHPNYPVFAFCTRCDSSDKWPAHNGQ